MLERRDRPLFGALIAIAVAVSLFWSIPEKSPDNKRNHGGVECTTDKCREVTATETVADYTRALAYLTGALAIVAAIQGVLIFWQIRLARDEYNATHRPKVVLQRIDIFDRRAGLAIVVANAGETSALVTNWYAKVYYRSVESAFWPRMGGEIDRSANNFWLEPGQANPLVTRFEKDEMGHGQFAEGLAEMYVVGTIDYRGRDGIARSTGFCRRWYKGDGTWRIVKHSEYEYAY